jgi:D-alanyl-D-alanine carboxypeptidase (penicillin-binding protein 5/6)
MMTSIRTIFYTVLILTCSFVSTASAVETKAKHAILIDADTEQVLFEKDASIKMTPSSMSKLMTTYMVFDRLKKGTLSLKDQFRVSEKAWRKQGSKMFVHVDDLVGVEDLLRGVIIVSGNDACITLAEGLMGSEEVFADSMNSKAKEIGLTNSSFKNSTGWPEEGHYMSAKDLSILALRLIKDFPEYYSYFAEKEFIYNKIKQQNRNMLLGKFPGTDGLKTGHTDEAGYGITVSAVQNGRRLILVVNGLNGTVERAREAEYLLQYGFLNFSNMVIAKKGENIAEANVWMGNKKNVPLTANEDIILTASKEEIDKIKVQLSYYDPIPAPIKKGDYIADLNVSLPDGKKKTYKLVAATNIDKSSFINRLLGKLKFSTK